MRSRRYFLFASGAVAASLSGCLGGSGQDEATERPTKTQLPSTKSDGQSTTSASAGQERVYTIGEEIEFDNGIKLTLEEYLTKQKIQLRNINDPTPRNGSEFNYETETPEPGSIFLILNIHIENTGETENPMFPSIEVTYKDEEPSYRNYGPGRNRFILIDGEETETFGYSRDKEGSFPGANVRGWMIDPVYLLPKRFETSDVRIEISISNGDDPLEQFTVMYRLA